MFEWIDGHLLLVAALCPVTAWVVVAWLNARLVRRCERRADIFAGRGA